MKQIYIPVLLLIMLIASLPMWAENQQEKTEDEKYTLQFYGFVRNDLAYESRRTIAGVGELFSFMPYDQNISANGYDQNAIASTRFLAVATRIGMNFESPLYKNGLRISAKIEGDFSGGDSYTLIRLRQANTKFNWNNKHILLAGQTWHPFCDILPDIISLNAGAPFNAFTRAPQVRYDINLKPITLSAAAVYQLQHTSSGYDGATNSYQVYGGLPEFYIGAKTKIENFDIALGGEFMRLAPRYYALDAAGEAYKVNEYVNSWAGQFSVGYSSKYFDFKAKSILGQNLGHLFMMSGYGVSGSYTNENGFTEYEYTPIAQSSSWMSIACKTANPTHNFVGTLFAGYIKNLGASKDIIGDAFYRGASNYDQIFRVSPMGSYKFKELQIGLEYEYTGVMYGDLMPNYTVENTYLVGAHRVTAIIVYNFNFEIKK
ncbi:MAG: hypothetical protein R3Y59_03940 [bacterium]